MFINSYFNLLFDNFSYSLVGLIWSAAKTIHLLGMKYIIDR